MHCNALSSSHHSAVGEVPVTHAAHILNELHRTLGFAGCPTDAVWPSALLATACFPVPGVVVPGEADPGMLVGVTMPDATFPYTLNDAVGADMHFVLEVPAGNPDLVSS
jgi:hypothetical protein